MVRKSKAKKRKTILEQYLTSVRKIDGTDGDKVWVESMRIAGEHLTDLRVFAEHLGLKNLSPMDLVDLNGMIMNFASSAHDKLVKLGEIPASPVAVPSPLDARKDN